MFKIMILICTINLAPQDCQTETAMDIIAGPTVSSELSCALSGQALLASTALRPDGREYAKILCGRSSAIASDALR
jgi:hypothetical protein